MCVFFAACIEDKVPYLPIEVSRMAASGPLALMVFRSGAIAMFVPLTMEHEWSGPAALLYVALVVIALVDDAWSQAGHMVGVVMLFCAAVWQTWQRGADAVPILVTAGVGFGLRLVAKAGTVWLFEMKGNSAHPKHRCKSAVDVQTQLREIATWSMQLMFGQRQFRSRWTKTAFRAAGVLQWVVFGILAFLFV